jgi:hypothetical protein
MSKKETEQCEQMRREMQASINNNPLSRAELEAVGQQVWDSDQLREDFEVRSFLAPFILVKRRSDGVKGTLMFQHHPRFYFLFEPAPSEEST